jgi:acetyl esterase/lipase
MFLSSEIIRSVVSLSVLILLAAASSASSQDVRVERDISYSDNGHDLCQMDLYLPAMGEGNGAAVFLIHGGGWKAGNRSQWTNLARNLAARGYVCASAGYRLVPEVLFPNPVEDLRLAMSLFKSMAGKYNFDPDRVGAVGSSAGGHLAALLATISPEDDLGRHPKLATADTRPAAAALYNPVLDFVEEAKGIESARNFLGGPFEQLSDVYLEASPARRIDKNFPPVLLLYGTDDTLTPVSNCVAMADSLYALDIPCEIALFPGQEHGFGYRLENPEQKRAALMVGDFFDRFLLQK